MVFQQPTPFPMSIYDNIAYGPRVHGIKDKRTLDHIVEENLKGAAIFDEVKDRLKKKYTVVVVTHNRQQAVRVSDDTAFFLLGEMVEFGNTQNLFTYPNDKRTENYITGRLG